ncbi:MAG: hypothetical protein QOJ81_1146 [Chloroflexota bacterium]|nr:hypothetical protein [Chloroflexota bacterium]
MRRLGLMAAAAMLVALGAFSVNAGSGYDQYGYNLTANSFNGTGSSWCLAGGQAANCMGSYSADKLGMKWNEQWDTCKDAGNLDPAACTGAWLDNQWNGKGVKGGSGSNWHYKFVWVGPCTDGVYFADGGYCIWGAYEVLMDHGHDASIGPGNTWYAHAKPGGYGSFK